MIAVAYNIAYLLANYTFEKFHFLARGWSKSRILPPPHLSNEFRRYFPSDRLMRSGQQGGWFYNRRMDHHTVAAVSIVGTCLDVLGSLYLAYDLLAGQHGPLRLLTPPVISPLPFAFAFRLRPLLFLA